MKKRTRVLHITLSSVIIFCILPPTTPSLFIDRITIQNCTLYDGTILYVGGSGPGNYTHIQTAINNASNGDTVFVYDDSSPYYENLLINKSICLLEENKNTTINDGRNLRSVISITVDRINVSEFTIQNCLFNTSCATIRVTSNFSNIENNIITHMQSEDKNSYGIYLKNSVNTTILKNTITNCYYAGIELENSHNNMISNNNVSQSYWSSLILSSSSNNTITKNVLTDTLCIVLLSSDHNFIHHNTLNATIGMLLANSSKNTITCNNIMKNPQHNTHIFIGASYAERDKVWDGNYWNKPRILPKIIFGQTILKKIRIPSIEIDWHPAKQPIIIDTENY